MVCFSDQNQPTSDCLQVVVEAMAEAVLIVDNQGFIRYCNPAAQRLTGKKEDDILGQRCNDLMTCACAGPGQCQLFNEGNISAVECNIRRVDGSLVPVLKNGRTLIGENGEAIGAVETLTDISALKRTELRLAEFEGERRESVGPGGIVGKSRAITEVFDLIQLAAASTATVLITGDTGTGKEKAATAIHLTGSRASGPLVKVNCAALPETLLESELFGHAKGAFTGAVRDKIGRFELADGGTLFLDEIGEISPLIQVKLLRFLQEHEFERVGESATRHSDVRVVSATSRDLWEMTRKGEFREDLYYRLKVFPINLPALRERKEDIFLLITHFIHKFNQSTGKNIQGLTHEALVFMMDYCWPGNIRELENAIEHAFVTCRSAEIDIFDLPVEIRQAEFRGRCETPEPRSSSPRREPARSSHGRITREELTEALEENRWNRTEAARKLGVDRTTVWRMMKKWNLT